MLKFRLPYFASFAVMAQALISFDIPARFQIDVFLEFLLSLELFLLIRRLLPINPNDSQTLIQQMIFSSSYSHLQKQSFDDMASWKLLLYQSPKFHIHHKLVHLPLHLKCCFQFLNSFVVPTSTQLFVSKLKFHFSTQDQQ